VNLEGSRRRAFEEDRMQTVSDIAALRDALARLAPGEPLAHGALSVVPLLSSPTRDPGWLTLAEAGDAAVVAEVDEAGTVPSLKVVNGTDRPLLLLDGEELVGARQNRVLNTSVLAAAHSTLVIPVSCVEAGRWHYRTRRFTSSDTSLYASARAKKAARVTASLRARSGHLADQEEVWADVAEKAAAFRVASPTGAMHDLYAHLAGDLERARAALAPVADQVGALVFVADRWVGLELFPCPRLFASAWSRLSAGYAAEGIGEERPPRERPGADDVLRIIAAAPAERAPAVGLGVEYRLGGRHALGAALVAEDGLAHLAAFPALADA
jgi:hypothetical protein